MSIGLIGTQKDIVNILMADPITKGDVKLLQQRLNEINKHIDPKGKPLAADGDFGPLTAAKTMTYLNLDPVLALNLSDASTRLLENNGQKQALQELLERGMPISMVPDGFLPNHENTPALATNFSDANGQPFGAQPDLSYTPTLVLS